MIINSYNLSLLSLSSMSVKSSAPDFTFKLVLVGDSGVGKSNLLCRFCKDEFFANMKTTIGMNMNYLNIFYFIGKSGDFIDFVDNDKIIFILCLVMIGVEFAARLIEINGKRIKAQIWDTSGQERYRAITTSYYRGAVGALLVYDITKPKTFSNLSKWLEELSNYADPSTVIGIIGNKSDLEGLRKVSKEEGEEFAAQHQLAFFETSAKDALQVNDAFMTVIMDSYRTIVSKGLLRDDAIQRTTTPTPKKLVNEEIKVEVEPKSSRGCC